ncbi:MAG: C4-dicarboxylate ABC transporter [Methylomicrobium sp.]
MADRVDKRSASPGPWLLILLLFSSISAAIENVSLDIGALNLRGWKFEKLQIALSDIPKHRQQLVLTIKKLALPKPFADLQLLDIRCTSFSWGGNQILCEQGKARIDSKHWRSPKAAFSFRLGEKSSSAKVTGLSLFGGMMNAELTEQAMQWQFKLTAEKLDTTLLQKQLGFKPAEIKNGDLSFVLFASGAKTEIGVIDLTASIDHLTLQTPDGKAATESLSSTAQIHADRNGEFWHWRLTQQLAGGALYLEPVYLEAGADSIQLTADGVWHPALQHVDIQSFTFDHADAAKLSGQAALEVGAQMKLSQAALSLRSDDLKKFSQVYLKPFAEQTALEGLSLEGRADADLILNDQALTNLAVDFAGLAIQDENRRIAAEGGKGSIHWSSSPATVAPSTLGWQRLSLYSLPIGPAQLAFSTRANRVELLQKTHLPFLGGNITLNRFHFQSHPEHEPDIYFEGRLDDVSLEQLSNALHWTPLSGTVSGKIPGVEYRDNTLKLGGELNIKAFDGNVKIANLASSGLFGDLPILSAEIALNHLDLDQITRRFEFGGITGRLSGFIKNLQLENWQPVGFFAWFGTPDDDDSRHRISQKAVQNIANIGGGGAADLLSRSFLRFFDTFGYDKIGLGCYLHDGICQMMGLEAAETGGYQIIKGGGLPRIDVIGYNSRIDWAVLIERLKRVTAPDQVIIK